MVQVLDANFDSTTIKPASLVVCKICKNTVAIIKFTTKITNQRMLTNNLTYFTFLQSKNIYIEKSIIFWFFSWKILLLIIFKYHQKLVDFWHVYNYINFDTRIQLKAI